MDRIRLTTKFKIGQQHKHTKAKFVSDILSGDELIVSLYLSELMKNSYGGYVMEYSLKNCRTGDVIHTTPMTLRKIRECFYIEECHE